MVESRTWNPWRALRERRHLTLEWAEMDTPGMIVGDADQRTVWLDYRLPRRERNAVLAHELVHDERNLLYRPDTPRALIDKEEVAVRREVARRLVPGEVLDEIAASGESLTAAEIADRLDVPEHVVRLAVRMRARSQ
jgi:hypothetical protein